MFIPIFQRLNRENLFPLVRELVKEVINLNVSSGGIYIHVELLDFALLCCRGWFMERPSGVRTQIET